MLYLNLFACALFASVQSPGLIIFVAMWATQRVTTYTSAATMFYKPHRYSIVTLLDPAVRVCSVFESPLLFHSICCSKVLYDPWKDSYPSVRGKKHNTVERGSKMVLWHPGATQIQSLIRLVLHVSLFRYIPRVNDGCIMDVNNLYPSILRSFVRGSSSQDTAQG